MAKNAWKIETSVAFVNMQCCLDEEGTEENNP